MTQLFLILMSVLIPFTAIAQTANRNRCLNPEETCMGEACNKRVPVIFGASYLVPKLKITLIDKNTNRPAAGAKMLVHYGFKWLEYPYYPNDEHPFGVWTAAAYSTDPCTGNDDGVIETDSFKVEPHGYYKGKYSFGHKPKFTNVSITYELPYVGSLTKHCTTSTDITRSQLERCRRKVPVNSRLRTAVHRDGANRRPNESLDWSGGSVFRIKPGAAKVEWDSRRPVNSDVIRFRNIRTFSGV